MNVMGCCHLLSRSCLEALPEFDLRFSPTQMDDIAHDIDVRLAGFEVWYCGQVSCVHHQKTGGEVWSLEAKKRGNVLGNDVKFFYKYCDRIDELKGLMNP